jgi:hypothetical protein
MSIGIVVTCFIVIPRLLVKQLYDNYWGGCPAVLPRSQTNLPLECLTECSPGLVTDSHCNLFNIIFGLTQKLAGFGHPPLPDGVANC